MPNPDLVTESNTFRAGNDNRDSSAASSLSRELWGAMGAGARGIASNDSTLVDGAKLVKGAASEALKDNSEKEIDGNKKPMTRPPFLNDQFDNEYRHQRHHMPKPPQNDACIDLTINIDMGSSNSHQGFNPGDKLSYGDIRPTTQPAWTIKTGRESAP
jgi:hypothetical protein